MIITLASCVVCGFTKPKIYITTNNAKAMQLKFDIIKPMHVLQH